MATVTPNFNWPVPTSTDLVKDGATAIEALGDSIDASLVDLKGGTSGQVLSKNSNTDMDFVWVTSDDANAIQNTIVDAKGDLITATAADTPARLAVGNNGETLVADSSTSTGLRYTAGNPIPNPVLNSSFQIAQRGTSFATGSVTSVPTSYMLDRWGCLRNGFAAGGTYSRQNTNDTTNLPNIQYCLRGSRDSGNTSTAPFQVQQAFETVNSIPFVGKTVTLSLYARRGADYSTLGNILNVTLISGTGTDQNPYTSYTGQANAISGQATLTTTWQRFSYTGTVSSSATELSVNFSNSPTGTAGAADYFEITGIQLDIGSVALPFRTNGATIQGELAACQRYYWRNSNDASSPYALLNTAGYFGSTTLYYGNMQNPVQMRSVPNAIDYANVSAQDTSGTLYAVTFITIDGNTDTLLGCRVAATVAGATAGRFGSFLVNNNSAAYIGISAEL
jgi:hypothetical protein